MPGMRDDEDLVAGRSDAETTVRPVRGVDDMDTNSDSGRTAETGWTSQVGDIVEYTGEGALNTPTLRSAILIVREITDNLSSVVLRFSVISIGHAVVPAWGGANGEFGVFAHNVRFLVHAEGL